MAFLKLLLALPLVLLAACSLTRDPTAFEDGEDRVTVHAVLVAGESEARVLLTIAPARVDPFQMVFLDPVPDAFVRLVAGSDTIALPSSEGADLVPCFANEPASPGTMAHTLAPGCHYAPLPRAIVEGGEYELLIDLPDGGRVHGRTVVPVAPSMARPAVGSTVTVGGAGTTVAWNGAGARRTELAFRPDDDRCTIYVIEPAGDYAGGFGFWSADVTGRMEVAVRAWPQCPDQPDGPVPARLVLSVFDTAYTRFAARSFGDRNPRLDEARAGIEGPAIGYFAGAARAERAVIVQ